MICKCCNKNKLVFKKDAFRRYPDKKLMFVAFGCDQCYKSGFPPLDTRQSYHVELSAEAGLIALEIIRLKNFDLIYRCEEALIDLYVWERQADGTISNRKILRQTDINIFDHLLINKWIKKLQLGAIFT